MKITLSDAQIEALAEALGMDPSDVAAAAWQANRNAGTDDAPAEAEAVQETTPPGEERRVKVAGARASDTFDDWIRDRAAR